MVERLENITINIDKGLSPKSKKLCQKTLEKGTVNDIIKKKELSRYRFLIAFLCVYNDRILK